MTNDLSINQINMKQCKKCHHIIEHFMVKCTKCGSADLKEFDPNKAETFEVTPEMIERNSEWYKKELSDEQKRYFRKWIPSGMSPYYYAGIIVATRITREWMKSIIPFELYAQPISITNARVYYCIQLMENVEDKKIFIGILNAKTN